MQDTKRALKSQFVVHSRFPIPSMQTDCLWFLLKQKKKPQLSQADDGVTKLEWTHFILENSQQIKLFAWIYFMDRNLGEKEKLTEKTLIPIV